MKTFTSLSFSLIALLFPVLTNASEGPSSGGGGYAVVCKASPVETANAQLLDLYEAQWMGRTLATGTGDLTKDYFDSVDRTYTAQGRPDLEKSLEKSIELNLKRFFRVANFVSTSRELPSADDVGQTPALPANCSLEQVAFFNDVNQSVTILKPVCDLMSSMDQAALVQHELVYREARIYGETDSTLSRQMVADRFDGEHIKTSLDEITSKSVRYSALGKSPKNQKEALSQLYRTPIANPAGLMRIQFTQIQGRALLSKTWIDLPLHKWNLKIGRLANGSLACLVDDPSQAFNISAPIQSTGSVRLSVHYIYSNGEPLSFEFFANQKSLGKTTLNLVNCQ